VAPLVVNVQNLQQPQPGDLGPLGKRNLVYDADKDQKYVQAGVGSGLIVQPGFILTNNHVVRKAERLRLTFAGGHSLGLDMNAVVVDALTDLAVIRLPTDLAPEVLEDARRSTPFADSDKDVHVGDWALAVGSPRGLKQTLTQGVISAKGRRVDILDMVELLQTDAAINPGNSGGPLFDQRGKLMGINVAIASEGGGSEGLGFAIPSNTVKKIVQHLIEEGEVPRGYLGVGMEELNGPQAKALGLRDDGGIVVKYVVPGQAAATAGLRVGDVIVKFNKTPLYKGQAMRHLRQLTVDLLPGAEVALEIIRGEERQTVRVTIGKRPADLR
jgi:serine protease Do